jgi:RNA polymerase sigma-70 factor (ECF subfamily)
VYREYSGLATGKHVAPAAQGSTRKLTKGEDAEFTALVLRQSRFVFRVAFAVLLNSHDAEDAVQETFLKLFRNGGWQDLENERAFLARVAWRIAVDRRPPQLRSAFPGVEAEGSPAEAAEAVSPDSGPERTLIAANQQALIHRMIDALPEELRVPLVLSANDELNSREIGTVLGVPESTVRTRLQRARQMLRQKLGAVEKTVQLARAEEAPYA